MNSMRIVERMRTWRLKMRYSQTEMAKMLNVDQKTISRWERLNVEPKEEQLEMILALIEYEELQDWLMPTNKFDVNEDLLTFTVVENVEYFVPWYYNKKNMISCINWKELERDQNKSFNFSDCLKHLINTCSSNLPFLKVSNVVEMVEIDYFFQQLEQVNLTCWIIVQNGTILKVFENWDAMMKFMEEVKDKGFVYEVGWNDSLTVVPTTENFILEIINHTDDGQINYEIKEFKNIKYIKEIT